MKIHNLSCSTCQVFIVSFQPKDGQKKKKKKKHKNVDSKYHVGLKGSNSDVTLQSGGTNTALPLPGSSINSAGVLFRDKNLETSLQRSNMVTNEKHLVDSVRGQRSDSSVSGSSSGTSFGSSEAHVCDKYPQGGLLQGVDSKVHGYKVSGLSLDPSTNFGGSKKSKASPPLPRNEKSFVKTHKRQKSLPNTPTRVPVVEILGRADNNALGNVGSDNLVKEKKHSLQKGTSKGKVRKSLSMTGSSKGSRTTANVVNGENKVNSSFKIERHSMQQNGSNKYNGVNDFSATSRSASCNLMNNSDSTYDNESKQRIAQTLGRGGIMGSKSCCSTDPGGGASYDTFNGHALNENGFMNGHSYNDLDNYDTIGKMNGYSVNENFHLDNNPSFQKKDNTDISNQTGWRKMIWWS